MPTLKIKAKHLHRSSVFVDNVRCPLALAANDHFGTKTAVGTRKIRRYETSSIFESYDIPNSLDIAILIDEYDSTKYHEDKQLAKKKDQEETIREMEYEDLNIPINA